MGAAAYEWCVNTGASSLPTGLGGIGVTCSPSFTTTGAATETLTASAASPIAGASKAYPFTVELDDIGNGSTPSSVASSASATSATSLFVNPVLAATITQSSNPTPATKLLDGVVNRSYGAVPTTLATAAPPVYSATGGLPTASGVYLWCINTGSVPPNLVGVSATCGPTTSTSSATVQLSASAASPIGGTGGAYTFSVQADDGGNPAVPGTLQAATGGSTVGPTSLTIHPQITLAQSLGTAWPDAVSGRAYGSGSNCTGGACAPAVYSATNGLGGYVWPAATPATIAAITGMSCTVVTTNYSCGAATVTAPPTTAGAAAISYSPSAVVTDTANAATPAATVASDPNSTRTDTVFVDSPLWRP